MTVGKERHTAVGPLGYGGDGASCIFKVVRAASADASDRVENNRGVLKCRDGVRHNISHRSHRDRDGVRVGGHSVGGRDAQVERHRRSTGVVIRCRRVSDRGNRRIDLCGGAGHDH